MDEHSYYTLISSPCRIFFKIEKIIPEFRGHHHAYGPHRFAFLGSRRLWLFRLFVILCLIGRGGPQSHLWFRIARKISLDSPQKWHDCVLTCAKSTSYQALGLSLPSELTPWSLGVHCGKQHGQVPEDTQLCGNVLLCYLVSPRTEKIQTM